jgi:predicted dehydrogenase/uncharacterized membrane protein YbhN (UPF0104 family)
VKLRGALLGAGNIALKSHAPQWSQNPDLARDVEIVAVADLSKENLERAKALLPGAKLYQSADELLLGETIDFVDICTPPFTHSDLVAKAAARGVHVVCEKPLSSTLDQAQEIVTAVTQSGIVFQPCHQYHYSPQWLALQSFFSRLGHVYIAEYEVHRTEANPGNQNWSPSWRTNPLLAGGGILADHGAHIFYQLRAVLGEPKTVQATVRTLRHQDYQVEDTALVTLDYVDCLAHVRLSWAARSRKIHFRFVGEAGEIVGNDEKLLLHAETTEEIAFNSGMSQNSSHAEWYAPLLLGFVEKVRKGETDTSALDEAVYVTRLISLAYQSSDEERALPLVPAPGDGALTAEEELVEGALATFALPEAPLPGEIAQATPPPTVQRKRRTRILRGTAAAALFGATAWTFHDIRWNAFWGSMGQLRPGWLALAAGVNLVVLLFQAARWLALVRPLSSAASLGQAFKSMIVGFSVSTVVPARAGEIARIEWLGRYTGISRMSIAGSVILDQLVNAAGLLAGVALLPLLVDVPLWMRQSGWFALALFVAGLIFVLALKPGAAPGPAPDAAPRRSRLPLRTISNVLTRVRHGLLASRDPRALGVSLGASLLAWGLEINVTTLSMRAVGLHLPIAASIVVLIAVNLALAFPFAPPANLGTLELGATLALIEFGIGKEQALAFAFCYHMLQVIPVGIIGFVLITRGFGLGRAPAPEHA